jgi:hypothetical protein
VYAVEATANAKLGLVSATYVAQQSCPESCVFLRSGCYSENGFTGGNIVKPLNRGVATTMSRAQIAAQEAELIDGLSGAKDLRLHVVGDSTTVAGTKKLAAAVARYMLRGGRRAWSYTHAWSTVPRRAWGPVSVLASCETAEQVGAAQMRGYATAIVVDQHRSIKLHERDGIRVLPCPEQTRGVSCADCRLCLDAVRLHDAKITIAFSVHGSVGSKGKALRALAGSAAPDVRSA